MAVAVRDTGQAQRRSGSIAPMDRGERLAQRLLDEQLADETRPAVVLMRSLTWTSENCMRIAREFINTEDDVPESVMHSFRMTGPGIAEQAQKLRIEHFARIGKPVPEYLGNFLR